jgi:hypothetical protein
MNELNIKLIDQRSRFIIIDDLTYKEIESPGDYYYSGIDLTDVENIMVTGTPKDCQLLVTLHSMGLVDMDLKNDDEWKLTHWHLLKFEKFEADDMASKPFTVDRVNEYLILHGENRNFFLPFPAEDVIDEDGNDIIDIIDTKDKKTLTFSEDGIWPSLFMSEKQIRENIRIVNELVESNCKRLRQSGIQAYELKDLVKIYLNSMK